MATSPPDPGLYEQLLALSQDAFAAGLYEVAYHTLSAALHWANSVHDRARLQEVAAVARVQRDQLALRAPAHILGVAAAMERGNRSLYDTLLLHAAAMIARTRGPGQ